MKNIDKIQTQIVTIREMKVMLDRDLAALYGVSIKRLNEQTRRNLRRFPADFMFQLSPAEYKILRSQFATSSWGGRRYLPLGFTEQGVAMLSSVLNSHRAIEVNIQIMRAFVQMRRLALTYAELSKKVESLERKYDGKFSAVFEALKRLMAPPVPEKRRIGFTARH